MSRLGLLIIDELGFVPLSQTGAELLFDGSSPRHAVADAGLVEDVGGVVRAFAKLAAEVLYHGSVPAPDARGVRGPTTPAAGDHGARRGRR